VNIPPAANRSYWESASGAINTYERCTQRRATATQASPRSEPLVSATAGASAPECGHRGSGQQTGSHGLGGLVQERALSRSDSCGDKLKSLFREKEFLPGLLAEIEMAMGLSHALET